LSENLIAAHFLYSNFVQGKLGSNIATDLWGDIPGTMGQAYDILKKIREGYQVTSPNLEHLKYELKKSLRGKGLLTKKVSDNIDVLENGVIESGQQPMVLGGPSLILNKIAYSICISEMGGDRFIPVFYIADYDGVQAELTNIRVPSPSSRGLLISYPVGEVMEEAPIRELPNPKEEWLQKNLEKIVSNYRGIIKGVDPTSVEKIMLRLNHSMSIIKQTYYSTNNVSEWFTKILGTILNFENDLGIPFVIASEKGIREQFLEGYEDLLAEPNRSIFIKESNRAAVLLEKAGYNHQIGKRDNQYVPFYYECESESCHNRRVELKYEREGKYAVLRGICSRCREEYVFSFISKKPDLTDIICFITPRVDSRQIIVDSVIPVLAHVGGPGETGYYAQIIPGVQKIGFPFPVFLRYSRTFYNTKWNEQYGKRVAKYGLPVLLDEELFSNLSKWVVARNSNEVMALKNAHEGIEDIISQTFKDLVEKTQELQLEIEGIKKKLRNQEDRMKLIQDIKIKQNMIQDIELYLSSAFGRFSPEKIGQEVNWLWVDLAIMSGLDDIMGVFKRQYNVNTPNSSMFFVNLS
jgi:uncharacterized protein YllA (UPF0747 family)